MKWLTLFVFCILGLYVCLFFTFLSATAFPVATPIKLNHCLESCELSVKQEEIKALLVTGKGDYTAKKYCFALHEVHDVLHFHIFLSFPLTHRQNICAISALRLHHLPPASSSPSSPPSSAGLLTHTFSSFSPHHPIHHASSFGFFSFLFFCWIMCS